MKKQYTKHQIQEAIKYWTERLTALDESKIKVIDDLIAKFGKDIVELCSRKIRKRLSEAVQD